MNIDIKVLNSCSELTDYEKDLILRVDIKGESQASVAKFYGKSPATVSIQHKKALEKFNAWVKSNTKQPKAQVEEKLDARVFQMFNQGLPPNKVIAEIGHADHVLKHWEKHRKFMEDDYCLALNIVVDWVKMAGAPKYPIAQRVQKLRMDELGLSLEKMFIWDLLKENGLTYDLDENEECAVYYAVEKLVNQTKKRSPQ